MPDDIALPNEQQRVWLTALMCKAFLEVRLLGWENKATQCADLADAFHNIPYEMNDPRNWSWSSQKRALHDYCEKYKGSRPTPFNYVRSIELIADGIDPSQQPH